MNPLQTLSSEIRDAYPMASVKIDAPLHEAGVWFLDIHHPKLSLVVEWFAEKGFGLSRTEDAAFGTGPDEVFVTAAETRQRIDQLLAQ
jgi:hypothetical protein